MTKSVVRTRDSLALVATIVFAVCGVSSAFAAPVSDHTPPAALTDSSHPSCHGTSHALGAAIAGRVATLPEAMVACGDRCTYGCVHGAFKAYFARRLTGTGLTATGVAPDVAGEISDLCREDSTILPGFYRGNCAHSVGHAFASAAPDVRIAASWCTLFASAETRFYCETGVFMDARQAIRAEVDRGRRSFAARAEAGVEYCTAHASAPGACLRFVLPWAEDVDEARTLVRACGRADSRARRGCVYAAGYASRDFVIDHSDAAVRVCEAAQPDDRPFCVAGIALMKRDHRDREALPTLCRILEDPSLRAVCEDQSSRFYYQLDNPLLSATLSE